MIFPIANWKVMAARIKHVSDGSVVVKDTNNNNWTITKAGQVITIKRGSDVRIFTVDYFLNCKFPAITKDTGEVL